MQLLNLGGICYLSLRMLILRELKHTENILVTREFNAKRQSILRAKSAMDNADVHPKVALYV